MWDLTADWHVVGVGDFNGDGMDDILLRNDDGRVTSLLGVADGGTFTDNPNAAYQMFSNWELLGTGDFNGDGRDEPVWRNEVGGLSEWLGQTDGSFWQNMVALYPMLSNWELLGTGDFNGDGRTDLLWRNEEGGLSQWVGQSDGSFWQGWSPDAAHQPSPGSDIVAMGDFNGDGRDDMLWRNEQGDLSEWVAQSDGSFGVSPTGLYPMLGWQMLGAGDFNGDGRTDLLWQNEEGALSEWLGQSDGTFWQGWSPDEAHRPSGDLSLVAIGDFNGDGRDDVLFRNADETLEIWQGAADGTLLSPEQQRWEAAIANVSEFFDSITNQVSGYSSGGGDQNSYSDQNSYYDDHSDHAPFTSSFMAMWGWLPSVQQNPAAHYWDFLTQDIDPEFQLTTLEGSGFSATFYGNSGSMIQSAGADDAYIFIMNGVLLLGVWHASTPPPPSTSDEIIVMPSGYWTFVPVSLSPDQVLNQSQPSPPPDGGSAWTGVNLNQVNPILGLNAPDGAQYYLPEGVTREHLIDTLNYLSEYAKTHDHLSVLAEFKKMYQDPTHPYFIDFKDWGTSNGPAGIAPVDQITYFSTALGHNVTASPFEAFGNWFYGFAGRYAGISVEELLVAAAILQEGNTGWFPADSPEDQPHVLYGMNAFMAFVANPSEIVFSINAWNGN